MHCFALSQSEISLGANAPLQALSFLLCFSVGIAFSLVTLLYKIKANPIERALVDLFATLVIGGGFVVCCEFFLNGKLELYGLLAYTLGIVTIPTVFRLFKRCRQTKCSKKSQNKSNLSKKDEKE